MFNPEISTVESYSDRQILAFSDFRGPIISVLLAAAQGNLLSGTILGKNVLSGKYEKYVAAVAASLITGLIADNNAIRWLAKVAGEDGNDISVALVNPGTASAALGITVSGTNITVSLATNAAVKATGNTGVEGDNNGLTYTSKEYGENNIMVILEDPHAISQALSVTVRGTSILVKLATSGAGAITSTAAQVKAAIEANADANALVTVTHTGASTGAAAVTDQVAELAGGVDLSVISTAAQVIAAITADAEASALLGAANAGASTGAGTVTALAKTNLAGGADANVTPSVILAEEVSDQAADVNAQAYLGGIFYSNMLVGMDAAVMAAIGARSVEDVTIVPV